MTKINPFLKAKGKRHSQGFSLVEVAMALGITGFAMISLIGLLPGALTSFKQAMGYTNEAQIVQALTNDLLLDNFSVLNQYVPIGTQATPVYYYDNEGVLLPDATGAVYRATIALTPLDDTNSPVTFNNNSNSAANPVIAAYSLVISITNVSDNSLYTQAHPHRYPVIIANNGL